MVTVKYQHHTYDRVTVKYQQQTSDRATVKYQHQTSDRIITRPPIPSHWYDWSGDT